MSVLARVIALASAAAAGVAGVSFYAHPPAAPARATDLCQPGLAQLVGPLDRQGQPSYVACLPVTDQPTVGARVDLRYSAAVAEATHEDTIVVCWDKTLWAQIGTITQRAFGWSTLDTGGFVWDKQQVANLPGRVCRYLDAVSYRGVRGINRSIAWAFKNLTHEAIHVAGETNEAATECYAIQLMADTITNLHLGHSYAQRVAQLSWSRYPHERTLDPIYWTASCHNKGALDLQPRSNRWPS